MNDQPITPAVVYADVVHVHLSRLADLAAHLTTAHPDALDHAYGRGIADAVNYLHAILIEPE